MKYNQNEIELDLIFENEDDARYYFEEDEGQYIKKINRRLSIEGEVHNIDFLKNVEYVHYLFIKKYKGKNLKGLENLKQCNKMHIYGYDGGLENLKSIKWLTNFKYDLNGYRDINLPKKDILLLIKLFVTYINNQTNFRSPEEILCNLHKHILNSKHVDDEIVNFMEAILIKNRYSEINSYVKRFIKQYRNG